ncbi:PREDICTED: death-associated protein 1 [Nipponia nippon]|nr:PREDICTED: death-associated protein 1 [Nipponia nippon]
MVSTRTRAIARRDVATQTELPLKHAATQVSGCRECQGLALVTGYCRDNTCVRCEQVEDLLSMVAELKEEVARLRSIRECERETDWWSRSLPSLRRPCQTEASSEGEVPLPLYSQAEGGDPREGEGWTQIPARRSRRILSQPTSPLQVPLHNRYEALEPEGQEDEDTDRDPSKGLTGGKQSAPRITTAIGKKKRWVSGISTDLLRVKAGGMRIVQKHPHNSDAKEEKDKDDQDWETSSPPKPTVFISGVIARGDKDFPPAAAQVAHQKPHPSVEKLPHPQHVKQHIHQPRK